MFNFSLIHLLYSQNVKAGDHRWIWGTSFARNPRVLIGNKAGSCRGCACQDTSSLIAEITLRNVEGRCHNRDKRRQEDRKTSKVERQHLCVSVVTEGVQAAMGPSSPLVIHKPTSFAFIAHQKRVRHCGYTCKTKDSVHGNRSCWHHMGVMTSVYSYIGSVRALRDASTTWLRYTIFVPKGAAGTSHV